MGGRVKQFITGSQQAYSDLESRARKACVVFRSAAMPIGCYPDHADVGFEIDSGGQALLLVKGLTRYTGKNDDVRRWVETGELRFVDFRALARWIRLELRREFPDLAEPLTDYKKVRIASDPAHSVSLTEQELASELTRRIKGQDDCIRILSRRVVNHIKKKNPLRPLSVFAVGPTGVGKTETAKCLGEVLTALDPRCAYTFLRLDMTEYQERHRVSQLLGAPQGYVGYEQGSQLLSSLANPRAIILFDEIEKAHPDIFKTLMSAMDAGRLTSSVRMESHEYTVDCRKAIFFFTSNLASSEIMQSLNSAGTETDQIQIDTTCRRSLGAAGVAPELIGRIQSFLVFRPITPALLAEIATLSVVRLGRQWNLDIRYIDPDLISSLINHPLIAQYGIRSLENAVEDQLGHVFNDLAEDFDSLPVQVCEGPTLAEWCPDHGC
jgi:ATP-dependent Clp protease ATP-binding subunit ClpA